MSKPRLRIRLTVGSELSIISLVGFITFSLVLACPLPDGLFLAYLNRHCWQSYLNGCGCVQAVIFFARNHHLPG
jgi:hypothetical protein